MNIKSVSLLAVMIISGCAPYSYRNELSSCLSVGKRSNQEIINKTKTNRAVKISNITPIGNTIYGDNDSTQCPVTTTYEDGHSEQGFLISNGRWSQPNNIEYEFLTKWEAHRQAKERKVKQKQNVVKIQNEAVAHDINSAKKFESARVATYPFKAEIYCYNTKSLNIYKPADCGIATSGKLGPTNLFDKQSAVFEILLPPVFSLKASMSEPNLFMGIKVDIRSRKTNEILNTQTGSYINTVSISN